MALFLAGSASRAHAIWEDKEGRFTLGGSIRSLAAGIDNYRNPLLFGPYNGGDALSQSILRLTLEGRPAEWISYELHGVQTLNYSSSATGLSGDFTFSGTTAVRYQAVDATWEEDSHGKITASLFPDRANVKLSLPWADITLGRQAITFGKAYFWNPLDVFLPFDPRQFDRDYKAGVDAARVDLPLGDFSGINLVAATGRTLSTLGAYVDRTTSLLPSRKEANLSWYGSAVMGRVFGTVEGWDLALQGGKVYGGYQLGGGTAGEFKTIEVRMEAAYLWAEDGPPLATIDTTPAVFIFPDSFIKDNFTGVIGLGRRFENSLTIESEYLFNGLGESGAYRLGPALIRYANGAMFHMSRNVLGVTASYEILPIVTGRLTGLISLDDGSFQIQPGVTWSVSDEIDLLAGAVVSGGKEAWEWPLGGLPVFRSEFGTFSDFYYVEVKAYF